ncbi:Lrp/AsnC family transcriptional regulator [Nanoarchaeota archaeon]
MDCNILKLDLKDKRILYELDKNCRQSCSEISRKVQLSQEAVNYRIKKLEEQKIITNYQLIVNLSKLGLIQFKVLLSFQHINSEKLNKIIEELNKKPEVKWVVSCKGNWDLLISLETDSLNEINNLKNKIINSFGNLINKKAISIGVSAEVYDRNFFLNKKEGNVERIIINEEKKVKLDEIDLEIIIKLSKNARKSVVDIASELKTSARIVNYRIKQLQKRKVINGFRISINYEKLGMQFYKLFLYLDKSSPKRINDLVTYFRSNKNIIHNVKVLGNWEFEPEFEVSSENEFNSLLSSMKDQFSDIIKTIDIITISKEHKFVYL